MGIFKRIRNLNYVVQRGWEGLPDEFGDDIDLFVDDDHYDNLVDAFPEDFPVKVDIRYNGDGYYPEHIERLLLEDRRDYKGIWIPSEKAYFLSLFYHAYVQGRREKYQKELKRAFLDWIPPVRPDDEGVIYDPT